MNPPKIIRRSEEIDCADGKRRRFDLIELTLQPSPISIRCLACGKTWRSDALQWASIYRRHHACETNTNITRVPKMNAIYRDARRAAVDCPACKGALGEVDTYDDLPLRADPDEQPPYETPEYSAVVKCACGYSGPSAETLAKAIDLWNHNALLLAANLHEQKEAA